MPQTIKFTYKNHRDVVAERTVDVEHLHFIKEPGFGYEPGWFISGFCHDKQARRSFSLANIERGEARFFMLLDLNKKEP